MTPTARSAARTDLRHLTLVSAPRVLFCCPVMELKRPACGGRRTFRALPRRSAACTQIGHWRRQSAAATSAEGRKDLYAALPVAHAATPERRPAVVEQGRVNHFF